MASRNFHKVQALSRELKIIAGSFSIAASGGAATRLEGRGFSVAKSNTGVYTITLADKYQALVSACATVKAATAVDLVAQIKTHDVSSAKTVVIDLNAGATPTEPSAVTEIHFVLMLRNSTAA